MDHTEEITYLKNCLEALCIVVQERVSRMSEKEMMDLEDFINQSCTRQTLEVGPGSSEEARIQDVRDKAKGIVHMAAMRKKRKAS